MAIEGSWLLHQTQKSYSTIEALWLFFKNLFFFIIFNNISLFIGLLGLCCCRGFSPVAARPLLESHSSGSYRANVGSRAHRVRSCGERLAAVIPGSRTQARSCGLWALWPLGSSWTRDRTRVSRTGRQTLYHWATSEAPQSLFFIFPHPFLCLSSLFCLLLLRTS